MKRETAIKVAAAEAGVTLEEATNVIHKFLSELEVCLVCEGTHAVTYERQVEMTSTMGGRPVTTVIPDGSSGPCPRCSDGGDLEWVVWQCWHDGYNKCIANHTPREGEDHSKCDYFLVLPRGSKT